MEKPKRPLSSFNLFYRYKRSLLAGQGDIPEETIKSIISCPAGLEDDLLLQSSSSQRKHQRNSKNSNKPSSPSSSETNNEIRRNKIRTALEGKILPSDTTKKRRHRKAADGPSLSFVEMGRMMTESWKSVDPYAKQVFDDLALEGKVFYRDTLKEYYRLNPGEAPGGGVIEEQQQCGGDDDGVTTASPTNNNNVSKKKTASSSKKMGQTNNKKVTVHKVSRCVKRASSSFSTSMSSNNNDPPSPIKSMMNNNDMLFNRGSMEPLSVDFGTSSNNNDGLFMGIMMDDVVFDDNEGPLRPKAPRRHTCPNPEDIARLLANSGFGPGPISPTTSSGRKQAAYGDDCNDNNSMQPPFPRQPYSQFGNSHQFPQPPPFDNHGNTWNELDFLEPLSISPTNNSNNVASTGYRHHHHHQGVNEGKLPITSTTTNTTTTASIDHQPQGYGNEWRLSASLSRPTYHRSASLPSGAASMNMNSFLGADLRMKVANNRIGSPIMMTMGSCCDTHDTHNNNNLPSPPPLTPVSQSSGSGRSLLSDISIHHQQRQMYHQQQFFQQYQQQQQHYEQQLQQKHNEQQQQKRYEQQQQQQQHHDDDHSVHFKTTGLTSQDPFDNFHPIHHDDGYDAHNIPPRPASAFFHHHKEKVNDMMQNNIQTAVAAPAPAAGDVGLLEGDQVDFLDDYFDNPKYEDGRGEMTFNSEDVRTFFDAMD